MTPGCERRRGCASRASLVAMAVALVCVGCGDECAPLAGKCVGNTTWVCSKNEHEPWRWFRGQDCEADRFCRSSSHGAVCSLLAEPDPACADTAGNSSLVAGWGCADGVRITCGLGYRTSVGENCGRPALCDPGQCAVVGQRHHVCGKLVEPNALVRTACHNNQVFACREGALIEVVDCGAGACTQTRLASPDHTWCLPYDNKKCVPHAPEPFAECY
jgi:hypothetical protein